MTSPGLSPRRVLFACATVLVCFVAAFALPSVVWNAVSPAQAQQADSARTAPLPGPTATPAQEPGMAAAQDTARVDRAMEPVSMPQRLVGLIGVAMLIGAGYAMSRNRARINWRVIATGFAMQVVFAVFVLRVPLGQRLFAWLGDLVATILGYSYAGSSFVFGVLGERLGGGSGLGVIFALQILPAIIFVSALFAILYYLGIMQVVVKAMAIVMAKLLKVSGAESTGTAANVFMGQTEAPLAIRPFIPTLTRSELMTVMTAGFATVSGSILAAYLAFGIDARHLLTAVVMTAPGSIMMAKLLEPEVDTPETMGNADIKVPITDVNLVDAASRGSSEGLQLMLNVIAMLIAFIALVALLNGFMGWVHGWAAWFPQNLQTVLAWVGRPVAWAIGVPWQDAGAIGGLIGERMVLNEFIAFKDLGEMRDQLSVRAFTIASYALVGFANISSVGIQLGGIGALAPNRKHDLARLGFRAMLAGTMANLMSATIAGLLL